VSLSSGSVEKKQELLTQGHRMASQKTRIFMSAYVVSVLQGNKKQTDFDAHVTVHLDKFLIIKQIRCTNFSNLFLE
jgi:hypothetical protein